MSTSEEVREQPPDPPDAIFAFRDSHSQLIKAVLRARSFPSHPNLDAVSAEVINVGGRVDLCYSTSFFRNTGEELAVASSLESIKNGMEDLVMKTKTIDPNSRVMLEFEESDLDQYISSILHGDEELAVNLSSQLCMAYNAMAEFLETTLINTPPVSTFIERDFKSKERKEQLKYYGSIAAAAFAGTMLANQINRRK